MSVASDQKLGSTGESLSMQLVMMVKGKSNIKHLWKLHRIIISLFVAFEKFHHYVCLEKVSLFCSGDRECFCSSSKDNVGMAKISVSLCFPIYHMSRSSYKAYCIQCHFHLQETKGMKNVNPYGDWLKEICYSSENNQHHSDTHVREMARFYSRAARIFSVKITCCYRLGSTIAALLPQSYILFMNSCR